MSDRFNGFVVAVLAAAVWILVGSVACSIAVLCVEKVLGIGIYGKLFCFAFAIGCYLLSTVGAASRIARW